MIVAVRCNISSRSPWTLVACSLGPASFIQLSGIELKKENVVISKLEWTLLSKYVSEEYTNDLLIPTRENQGDLLPVLYSMRETHFLFFTPQRETCPRSVATSQLAHQKWDCWHVQNSCDSFQERSQLCSLKHTHTILLYFNDKSQKHTL